MKIILNDHILTRMQERKVTEREVHQTILEGESYQAALGRVAFRRNFIYNDLWRGKHYGTKQVEVIAVQENDAWIGVTVVSRFF